MEYEPVIGLEIHIQLKTLTKIFCSCKNTFEDEPNKNICPVCLGLPGVLPVLNKEALRLAMKVALALNCKINSFIKFDRKNYFYPDLPKNYQISQYSLPLAEKGYLDIITQGEEKRIFIRRLHMEEDAGKLVHLENYSLVDFNRAGCPLIEIVTEPVITSAQQAYDFLQQLKILVQYVEASDCDMEKGTLRCDANVSLRRRGEEVLGTRTEIKNMNSFRALKMALDYEIKRQESILREGGRIVQETRLWDEKKQRTFSMRSKEEVHDYRYFPEPDLVPFTIEKEVIDEIKAEIPSLPLQRLQNLRSRFSSLSFEEAFFLVQEKSLVDFFEECVSSYKNWRSILNWIKGGVMEYMNSNNVRFFKDLKLQPSVFIDIVRKMDEGALNNQQTKKLLFKVLETGKSPQQVIKEEGLEQISDEDTVRRIIDEVLHSNPKAVQDYKQGKTQVIGFLVGQVMKITGGKVNPKKVKECIERRLVNEETF